MRHFCSPELDCLGKTIRRVRGSGDSTYSHVVGQVSKWVRKSSQAAGQPRGEKALVSVLDKHTTNKLPWWRVLAEAVGIPQPACGAERDRLATLMLLPPSSG